LVHYAIIGGNATPPCETVPTSELPYIESRYMIVAGIFTVGWVMVSVFFPFCLTSLLRWIRDSLGTSLLSVFLVLAVVTSILAVVDISGHYCLFVVFLAYVAHIDLVRFAHGYRALDAHDS
jgi:hypothetical protein